MGAIWLAPMVAVGVALVVLAVTARDLRRGADELAAEAVALRRACGGLDALAEAAARLRDSGPPRTPR